ncbi:hypothetical protein GBA52_003612 [Prunus armeniaca]|nr:hypothetical protein GBA52_003612 [Prunus armeniaca]
MDFPTRIAIGKAMVLTQSTCQLMRQLAPLPSPKRQAPCFVRHLPCLIPMPRLSLPMWFLGQTLLPILRMERHN